MKRPGSLQPVPQAVRCAVYCRQSVEEKNKNGFGSLDAQREAGEKYVSLYPEKGWAARPDQVRGRRHQRRHSRTARPQATPRRHRRRADRRGDRLPLRPNLPLHPGLPGADGGVRAARLSRSSPSASSSTPPPPAAGCTETCC